jgi:type VI secretion system protein ImpH
MADKNRNKNTDLDFPENLAQAPYHFGFYEALRQLECLHNEFPRIGYASRPEDDKVRLGQTPSLQFAPATLASFEIGSAEAARLSVYFFGLFGPNGPLPLHLTEYVRDRIRNVKDTALADFTDMFHHRLLSLFYRAWADKEPTVQLDRPEQDRFICYVGSLLGLGEASLQQRDAMPDYSKLYFAGHLGSHNCYAEGLTSMLSYFFEIPVKIQEFIGEWLDMPEDSYCYLGRGGTTGQLGMSATIGTRSWQCQHKFRIIIGPVNLEKYMALLPGSGSLQQLVAIVRNYLGFEFNWDVNLLLYKDQVPDTQLGQFGQLGWTSWLQGGKRDYEVGDLYLNIEDIA